MRGLLILKADGMAKAPDKEIEFHSDAMERFERAVKAVAKSPPQHRAAKKKKPVRKKAAKVTRE
jgi:hypothetical protein